MIVSLFAAALLQSAAQPAPAPATPPAQEKTAEGEKLASNEKICRTHRVTGSRVKREKMCMTAHEWELYDEAHQNKGAAIIGNGVCTGGECTGT